METLHLILFELLEKTASLMGSGINGNAVGYDLFEFNDGDRFPYGKWN
jgi:hypothetical protein